MSGSATQRLADGEQLVVSTRNPDVRHVPRHPNQVTGFFTSLCNRTVIWVMPDAPAMRGRGLLPLCPECARRLQIKGATPP